MEQMTVFFGWNVLLIFCLTWDPGDVTIPCSSSDLSRNIWNSDESDFQNVHWPLLSPVFPMLHCERTHSHQVRKYIMVLSMRVSNLYYFLPPGGHCFGFMSKQRICQKTHKRKKKTVPLIFSSFLKWTVTLPSRSINSYYHSIDF